MRPGVHAESIKWLFSGLYDVLRRYYLGVISFIVTIIVFTQFFHIGISLDGSLPDDHLYVVKKWNKSPERGAKVGIRTVKGPIGPPEGLLIVKYIYGMPGDVVTVGGEDGRDVFINGDRIAHAKRFTKNGKPLTVIEPSVIPEGKMFVGTPSRDSYDSRYATLGFVSFEQIDGRVATIF